jgi:hypothetical protein
LAATLRNFHCALDHFFPLIMRQSGRLTSGANRDDSGDSARDLGLNQFFKRSEIDRALLKGRH